MQERTDPQERTAVPAPKAPRTPAGWRRGRAAMLLALALCAPPGGADPRAQEGAAAPARTAKERLGDKSTDDQRLDNCKVPPEKQGARQRTGTCDHLRTS